MKTKLLLIIPLLIFAIDTQAGSATWNLNPTSSDWNTATNWTPATVPDGSSDRATLALSNLTNVSTDGFTQVKKIIFTSTATNAFTITVRATTLMFNNILAIGANGIVNESGVTQNFVAEGSELGYASDIIFHDGGTAGSKTTFTTFGAAIAGQFGGFVTFQDTASAADGIITNNGGLVEDGRGGETDFVDSATAGNATLIANGGDNGNAGGTIGFFEAATGGSARLELFGNGNLDVSGHDLPGITVGSLAGEGNVFLGGNNLTAGGNNSSTLFSGVIQDGGVLGGVGGSLTKVGSGTLTIDGASTYTGGTTLSSGTLVVNNQIGSATGTGAVQVASGTLGGSGRISGPVTVGTDTRTRAFLAPSKGVKETATLTIESTLTLKNDATYTYKLDTKHAKGDEVTGNGVTIDRDATFAFRPNGFVSTLMIGQSLTVINNTAATPISGTFHNLAQGEVLFATGNYLQVSYVGGDGNDLTLTVIR